MLALLLATPSATGAPPRCREVPAAEARNRLEVWGRELAGAKGPVARHGFPAASLAEALARRQRQAVRQVLMGRGEKTECSSR
jgi:hypothetical protein